MAVKKKTKNSEGDKNREFKLKIGVSDFGPISSGNIEIKPCTILLGPNNAGKSYYAMLLYTILGFFKPNINDFVSMRLRKPEIYNIDIDAIWKKSPEVKEKINNLKLGDKYKIPDSFIEKIGHLVLDNIFHESFSQKLIHSYASPMSELVRVGGDHFSFKIDFNSSELILELKKNNLKIKNYPKFDFKIIAAVNDKAGVSFGIGDNEMEISIHETRLKKNGQDYKLFSSPLIDQIIQYCENYLIRKIAVQCHYLPAARTGILLLYKALLSNIVKKAPHAGTVKFDIPKFSGVISEFISFLIDISGEKSQFFDLAEEFEKKLIKGQIIVKTVNGVEIPEIKYRFKDKEIALHRSSSTVSELAPLFLYLKYSIKPGDLLIIEEPEAHLHPENQRIMAKLLVRLVRNGIRLFITTHSEYLLEQLSSFVMLSQFKDSKKMEEFNFDRQDYLEKDEIGAYVFRYEKKGEGYKIDEVEVNEEDGISQEEFVKVYEALYEESYKIQHNIQEKK